MKKINSIRPKAERALTVRFEAPKALKQAKPLQERNAKPRASLKKFR